MYATETIKLLNLKHIFVQVDFGFIKVKYKDHREFNTPPLFSAIKQQLSCRPVDSVL
jgi:hypothetical protein